MHHVRTILQKRSTIVIKIGTNLLTDKHTGIRHDRIEQIARSISSFLAHGHRVAIVSSGAIGAGSARLGFTTRPRTIPEKQAAAAIGQPVLMAAYEAAFRHRGHGVAQILLTKDDFVTRHRYVNAKRTFAVLLDRGIVPIINENDTVAVEEIKLGDNDNLSSLVANLIEADLLVLLSDVDGLYSDDPGKRRDAELIPVVAHISPQIEKLAKRSRSELSTGGMITKIQAARRCASVGIAMIIANGNNPDALESIVSGEFRGTLFLPAATRLNLRKRWIGFVSHPRGSITIDSGATQALLVKHRSLLPSGVLDVAGEFKAHDTVSIRDTTGGEIARGVSSFSSAELVAIKGKKSGEAEKILGRRSHAEVVHKDNLVLMKE